MKRLHVQKYSCLEFRGAVSVEEKKEKVEQHYFVPCPLFIMHPTGVSFFQLGVGFKSTERHYTPISTSSYIAHVSHVYCPVSAAPRGLYLDRLMFVLVLSGARGMLSLLYFEVRPLSRFSVARHVPPRTTTSVYGSIEVV